MTKIDVPGFEARLADPSEFMKIDALVDRANEYDYGVQDNSWDDYHTAELRHGFPLDIWVVYRDNGELVATISSRQFGQRAVYEETEPHEMDLRLLAVSPDARREGIAAKLMLAIIEHAKKIGFTRLVLKTEQSMHGAHRLYEKLGMQVDEYRSGIWLEGEKSPDINNVICYTLDF
ncbi:MAG: GNAT family N-acetyltransferase [Microbacteriaceae bacterium]|nr:GNAT family N-acetyltransferase [Microbacteriaceae bacterium]